MTHKRNGQAARRARKGAARWRTQEGALSGARAPRVWRPVGQADTGGGAGGTVTVEEFLLGGTLKTELIGHVDGTLFRMGTAMEALHARARLWAHAARDGHWIEAISYAERLQAVEYQLAQEHEQLLDLVATVNAYAVTRQETQAYLREPLEDIMETARQDLAARAWGIAFSRPAAAAMGLPGPRHAVEVAGQQERQVPAGVAGAEEPRGGATTGDIAHGGA